MGLRLVRVDDRLIHGQVVAIWLKALGARRILIVDDRTAHDEFLREVLELAAPAGTPVEARNAFGRLWPAPSPSSCWSDRR
jgi:mannose/fructose/N-acetylgalactosamine-specific phosphotransferase system component IIB